MAQIKTYARLKPSKRAYPGYEIANNVLTVHIPDNKDFLQQGSQQPIRSNISYDIIFTDIFRPEATQEEVFDGVARDIIQNFLNGYNGTIFAYGQTGTGKTYTVEGNSSGHNTRGLATRALSMIYQQLEKRTDEHISVYLSYLEIYQEVAYDLLNPASRSSSLPMAPFAKSIREVTVVEGPRGSCILRGLSLHLAANEEIAQMLLFQGQTNRKVAETPVNQRSSRSHAVFTVYLQVRKHESEVLVNSKLHLVDLAGSERVSKTGVDGQQLTEAKSINLSLHHLETVIIALQSERTNTPSNTAAGDKSKGDNLPMASRSTSFTSGPSSDGSRPFKFVPYRNSLLTMVLKDSLGGNCLTAMIATISLEPENLGESISTCRFAQRVARIANNARRNEEIDDKTLIRRLKHKVADLENQVARLRSKGKSEAIADEDFLGVLTEEDRLVCAKIMEGFLQGVITDPVDAGICDQCRFRECLHFLKYQCLQMGNMAWPPKILPQQVQQERETPSDHSETVLPNNPHRDSGDHVMNTTSQGTSPIAPPIMMLPGSTSLKVTTESAQQSSSEATIHSCDDFLLDNPDIGQAEGGLPIDKDSSLSLMKKMSGSAQTANILKKGDKQKSSSTDRKKEADSKKVGKKVNRPEDDRISKQEHLDKIKLDALLNELTVTENNLSLKLHVTDEQVVDQHAYLTQLKQLQADPELIAKELLVEKHLLKRQVKFRDKLTQVVLQKSKLERSRNQDVTSVANSISSKVSMDELSSTFKQNKGPVNTKLVYDLLRAEDKAGKETMKVEKDVLDKSKILASKEAATLEKLQELKHILKMSQKPKETELGLEMPLNTLPKEIDKMESNQSSLYHPLRQNYDSETDDFLRSHSLVAEDRNGSRSKDIVLSSSSDVDASDMHVKRLQEYLDQVLNVAFIDKFASDVRPADPRSPSNRNHGRAGPSQPIYHCGGAQDIIISNISPGCDGVMPMEVKSLHDPRHSHKFAMDDRPYESSSLVTPEKNNIETLYSTKNVNNSTDVRSISSRCSKSLDRKFTSKYHENSGRNHNNSNNCVYPSEIYEKYVPSKQPVDPLTNSLADLDIAHFVWLYFEVPTCCSEIFIIDSCLKTTKHSVIFNLCIPANYLCIQKTNNFVELLACSTESDSEPTTGQFQVSTRHETGCIHFLPFAMFFRKSANMLTDPEKSNAKNVSLSSPMFDYALWHVYNCVILLCQIDMCEVHARIIRPITQCCVELIVPFLHLDKISPLNDARFEFIELGWSQIKDHLFSYLLSAREAFCSKDKLEKILDDFIRMDFIQQFIYNCYAWLIDQKPVNAISRFVEENSDASIDK